MFAGFRKIFIGHFQLVEYFIWDIFVNLNLGNQLSQCMHGGFLDE